ncbi:hypothetical protein DFH29DRAFT_925611 [Suillus ampliporus]|nr:hypothetical protein DFH29DRAFT_925611 [Suillus ampliporus]
MSLPTRTQVWRVKNSPVESVVLDSSDDTTFALSEEPLPDLEDGEMLVENVYFSNDPVQRSLIQKDVLPGSLCVAPVREGDVVTTHSIARILAIDDNTSHEFKVDDLVFCMTTGWRRYAVVKANSSACLPLTVPENVPVTAALGLFGISGYTAYYGLKDILKLKEGDSLIVSGAAGAVGNIVVQYAKNVIKAKIVIGITGSEKKCKWLKEIGADIALNYKADTFAKDLDDATPDLVDAFFDNVGGFVLDRAIARIKRYGRIAACGSISGYDKDVGKPTIGTTWSEVTTKCLAIQGFTALDFMFPQDGSDRVATEGFPNIAGALQRGDITLEHAEEIVEVPFTDVPKVWGMLFTGANSGKLVTKLKPSA